MPGIAETAADCAGLQFGRWPQIDGVGVDQIFAPVAGSRANNPPPTLGSSIRALPRSIPNSVKDTSETGTYTDLPSEAEPHCTPPRIPPRPTRVCHRTRPL